MVAGRTFWTGPAIGVVFLVLAGWFLFGPDPLTLPAEQRGVRVHPSLISTDPRRSILSHPPTIHINAFDRTCMECHRTFPNTSESANRIQHKNIVLDHGNHRGCFGCHDRDDRDLLVVGSTGKSIKYDDVATLCAHCHERVFNEWTRGSHGRSNGYWDESVGERRRLQCTECHDPHQPRHPAMDPIAPLPPPRTLRMGERLKPHEDDERHNPLRPTRADAGGHR